MPETFDVDFEPEQPAPPLPAPPADAPPPEVIDAQVDAQVRPSRRQLPAVRAPQEQPHSLEAEEYLLSCIFIDGDDILARCKEQGITPRSFFSPANSLIFSRLLSLHERGQPADIAILAEDLKATCNLDAIGGFAYLAQVSSRIPTTAQAPYFIERVADLHRRRVVAAAAQKILERIADGNLDELTSHLREAAGPPREKSGAEHMPWDTLLAFDPKADSDCLFGNRYLGRGDALLFAAQSGVGKSVLGFQWGACAALGRPIFGLRVHRPMHVLLVQAEDSLGDVAEEAQGFAVGFELSAADKAALTERFRIERWHDVAGSAFLARLSATAALWPFDLLIVNPLLSFAGCNLSEQEAASAFLRNGLNPILAKARAACLLIHHTGKPPKDENGGSSSTDDLNYLAFGSSELTNWARAIVTLQAVKSAGTGTYKLTFAKRGTRTGITGDDGNLTRSVYVEHAKHGLCWLPSDWRPEVGTGGRFSQKFDLDRAKSTFNPDLPWTRNEAAIAADQGVSPRTVRTYRKALETVDLK